MKRDPDGHKRKTVQIILIQLISLKAFFESTNENPQFSMDELASQIYLTRGRRHKLPPLIRHNAGHTDTRWWLRILLPSVNT